MTRYLIQNGKTVKISDIENREVRMAAVDYLDLSRFAWADRMLGHQAKKRINECVRILNDNGYTHVENIFGNIEIKGFAKS